MEAIKTSSYYDGDIIKDSETLVFNPYNPNNKEITLNEVQSILQFYGINAKVFNLKLYQPNITMLHSKAILFVTNYYCENNIAKQETSHNIIFCYLNTFFVTK